MPICKICGKNFHACNNCGLSYSWEYEYCCEKCFYASDDYKETAELISICDDIFETLPDIILENLGKILDDDVAREYFLNKFYKG